MASRKHFGNVRRFTYSVLAASALLAGSHVASAAITYDWAGAGGASWAVNTNWRVGGEEPAAFTFNAGDIVNLTGSPTANQTAVLNGSYTIGTLNFGSSVGGAGYYRLQAGTTGSTLTFDSSDGTSAQFVHVLTAGAACFVDVPIVIAGTGGLTVTNKTVNPSSSPANLAYNVTFSQSISGSGPLVFNATPCPATGTPTSGGFVLSGDNSSFTGNVHIKNGAIFNNSANANPFGTGGTLYLGDASTTGPIWLDFNYAGSKTISNAIVVDSAYATTFVGRTTAAATFSGSVTINEGAHLSTTYPSTNALLAFTGPILGSGRFTLGVPTGTMTAPNITNFTGSFATSGSIEFPGNIVTQANLFFSTGNGKFDFKDNATIGGLGSLPGQTGQQAGQGAIIADEKTLTLYRNSTESITFSGQITGSGSLVKDGAYTQNIGNSTYTGSTIVKAGTLHVSNNLSGTSGVEITGGTFAMTGWNTVLNPSSTGIYLNGTTAQFEYSHASTPVFNLPINFGPNGGTVCGTGIIQNLDMIAGARANPGTADTNSIAALRVNVLTLHPGTHLDFDFGTDTNSDRYNIANATGNSLTFTGDGIILNMATTSVYNVDQWYSYNIITYNHANMFPDVLDFVGTTGFYGSAPTASGTIVLGNSFLTPGSEYEIRKDPAGTNIQLRFKMAELTLDGPFIGNSNTPTQFPEPWTTTARSATTITSEIKTADASSLTFDGGADILGTKATIT
ncbi:MAG: hypothetical protein FWD53_08230, partial [Phycisphaerales bacterium]|nr:hypothetical protein [Phycisphaerales bacterium]